MKLAHSLHFVEIFPDVTWIDSIQKNVHFYLQGLFIRHRLYMYFRKKRLLDVLNEYLRPKHQQHSTSLVLAAFNATIKTGSLRLFSTLFSNIYIYIQMNLLPHKYNYSLSYVKHFVTAFKKSAIQIPAIRVVCFIANNVL